MSTGGASRGPTHGKSAPVPAVDRSPCQRQRRKPQRQRRNITHRLHDLIEEDGTCTEEDRCGHASQRSTEAPRYYEDQPDGESS